MVNIIGTVIATLLIVSVIVIATQKWQGKSMTAHNHSEQHSGAPSTGGGSASAGQQADPNSTPANQNATTRNVEEEEIFINPPAEDVEEIPIGLPVDPDAVRALKRDAEQPDADTTAGQSDQS